MKVLPALHEVVFSLCLGGVFCSTRESAGFGMVEVDGHAEASGDGAASTKIRDRSGRSSWREMPVTRSTSTTRSSGTFRHCEMAWEEMLPRSRANSAGPKPAVRRRSIGSLMPLLKAYLSMLGKHLFQ